MRISLNWLRDYLDIKPDVDVALISNTLTFAGLEVEAIDNIGSMSQSLRLAKVVSVQAGPLKNNYILSIKGKQQRISGPKAYITEGMVVALKEESFATYGDLGFLCQASDPIIFDEDFFGSDGYPDNLSEVKEFDDVIFTLGITPNRADALSHLGVSRELSAILDTSARVPMLTPKEMAGFTHEKIGIEIENAEDCPRYACRIAENVIVQDSPFWLRFRLLSVGIRPINNVVDVTNYVMIARGQPMHAFDYDALNRDGLRPKIVVRRALPSETLVSLDGQKVTLSHEDVVITDGKKPLALAGIIGGKDCAVMPSTTTVLLESAYFDPKNVRMISRRHGINTESSYRFERGTDPNDVVDALNYAARLLTEVAQAKICREPIDAYRKRIDPLEIKMRPERAQAVLGIAAPDFDQDILRRKFLRLGIETVAKRGDAIYFRVPTHRSDLTREIDLIEEAARMIGYDKVKEHSAGHTRDASLFADATHSRVILKLREMLAALGFCEAINYAFLHKEWHANFVNIDDEVIEVLNPLSDRYGVLRRSLVPGLMRNLLHNERNQEKSISLFEIGTVFLGAHDQGKEPAPKRLSGKLDQDSFAKEKQKLAGVLAGKTPYYAFDQPERAADFYEAKGIIAEILQAIGFKAQYPQPNIVFVSGANEAFYHPGESASIFFDDKKRRIPLGSLGKLHPAIATKLDVARDVFLFELDIDEIAREAPAITKYKPFSRFPTIERDVAFLVDEDVAVVALLETASAVPHATETLSSIRIFDIYRGKNIAAGKKSVAITMALQSDDRTLTDEEAQAFVNLYVKLVEQKTGATTR